MSREMQLQRSPKIATAIAMMSCSHESSHNEPTANCKNNRVDAARLQTATIMIYINQGCNHDGTQHFVHLPQGLQYTSTNRHSDCNKLTKLMKATTFCFHESQKAITMNCQQTTKAIATIRELKKSGHKAPSRIATAIVIQLMNWNKSKCKTSCKITRARAMKLTNKG